MFEDFGKTELKVSDTLTVPSARSLLVAKSIRAAYAVDGQLVEATARFSGYNRNTRDDVPTFLTDRRVAETIRHEVIWGGGMVNHYGHFLTETVARLWPALPGGKLHGRPVVFTTPRTTRFIAEWMTAFGVNIVGLPPDGVTRFDHMFVPEPAWRLNAWVAPEIRAIHLHARQGLDIPSCAQKDLLWFSRCGLTRDRRPYDEGLLEWLLGRYVTVVQPEAMSLAEQVGMVESSRTIAGVVGSAFHTILLARRVPKCLLLCPGRFQSAHMAQTKVMNMDATHVYALAVGEATSRMPVKVPGGRRLLIPETIRALGEVILPALLDDPDIQAFGYPEQSRWRKFGSMDKSLALRVVRVLLDPYSVVARMKLGEALEAEGLSNLAAEQFLFVADSTQDYIPSVIRAARLLSYLNRTEDALEMANRALALDPDLTEAKNIAQEALSLQVVPDAHT